jgi:hypothetical protein
VFMNFDRNAFFIAILKFEGSIDHLDNTWMNLFQFVVNHLSLAKYFRSLEFVDSVSEVICCSVSLEGQL